MLTAHGAPAWFIDKALSTGADSMWFPSHADLVDARIVTRIVDPNDFGLSGIPSWRDKQAIERGLLSFPLYALIRDRDPEGFRKIIDQVSESTKVGKTLPEAIQDVRSVFGSEVLPRYLRTAPDSALQRYWRSQLAEMEHLRKRDPAQCVAFSFPELHRGGFDLGKSVPAAVLAEDLAALTDLIKQATDTPQKGLSANLDEELAGVMTRVSSQIPNAQRLLSEPSKYLSDSKMLCDVIISYYTDILSLPASRSGAILRSFAEP
jgi:hypothetical protein